MSFLSSEVGDAAFRKLMSAPVSAPRKRIRRAKVDVVESSGSAAGKSLADIYRGRRAPYVSPLSKRLPTYRQWLGKVVGPADADREALRARAEWAAVRSHPFIGAVYRGEWPASHRARRAVDVWIAGRVAVALAMAPAAPERKPSVRKSRNTWPDYREQQRAAIAAADALEAAAVASSDVPECSPC